MFLMPQMILSQEMSKNKLYFMHEEAARIDKIDEYNQSAKDFTKMFTDMKLDVPAIYASESDDYHFFYLVPINNYADVDKLNSAFNDLFSKADKDKMAQAMKGGDESTLYTRDFVLKHLDELSYKSDKQKLDMSKETFMHLDYYTYKPEYRKQVMDLGAEFKKLYQDKGIEDSYDVWTPDLGEKNNVIIVTTFAKDATSFYQQQDKDNALLGKEADAIWNKMQPMLENFNHNNAHTRPDLSYMKSK
jgi:hypothetical protein